MLSYTTIPTGYSKVPGSITAKRVIGACDQAFLFSLVLIIVHWRQILLRLRR